MQEELEELREWRAAIDVKLDNLLKQAERLFDILQGNGKEGLVVQVDRNTQDLKRLGRFVWMVAAAVLGAIAAALF